MIVETPRGSGLKFKYEPKLKLFAVGNGLTYPFEWGFIPGTKGEDGDPLDALGIHDASTYPGILLQCPVLGAIELNQKVEAGREANPRS